MRTQRDIRSAPGAARGQQIKLLLVGREFKSTVPGELMCGKRSCIAGKSETLLGALTRLQSEGIDIVLLSHTFRDEELALFAADARRSGFHGLILRVASLGEYSPDSSATREPSDDTLCANGDVGARREHEQSSGKISFTDRQRTVLAHVSEGWTNQQIAHNMKSTEAAVKAVMQELFRKLEVRSRAQVVRVAIEKRLIHIQGHPRRSANETREAGQAFALVPTLKDQQPIHVGDFIIDVAMHQAWVRGIETRLTPREFQLLWIFATHSGKLVKSSTLREMFWRNPTARVGSLRVLVGALRAKIEATKTPRYLITERSLGYRFIPSLSVSEADRPAS